MKVALVRFPGANCEQDGFHALNDDLGITAEYVWHAQGSLDGYDAVFLPGGFTYGDYLRCGAIAARANIMSEVIRFANEGRPVFGPCNGFQVLCEAGLLPGALMQNESERFRCENVFLKAVNRSSPWTRNVDQIVSIPIAHGEGRYVCDDDTLKMIHDLNLVAFQYVNATGELTESANPNGSMENIAGLVNKRGNVLGMMPHPERATKKSLGGDDGLVILRAFAESFELLTT